MEERKLRKVKEDGKIVDIDYNQQKQLLKEELKKYYKKEEEKKWKKKEIDTKM